RQAEQIAVADGGGFVEIDVGEGFTKQFIGAGQAQEQIVALTLVKAMTSRMRQSEALIALLGLRRIEDRVRGFLELLAQDYGQPCEQGLLLNLRLTHQDIANALSTTRVTVTRVLGLLREEGWLQLDDQRQLVVSHLPRG
ncbi:MAG: hypothetical protein RLZZ186_1852, partial [Cyanobacteriota bacterium]